MKFIYTTLISLFLVFPISAWGQSAETEIEVLISDFFTAMNEADTTTLSSYLHPDARLWTAALSQEEEPMVQKGSIKAWLTGVANAPKGSLEERLTNIEVRVDADRLAQAWTPYRFYYQGSFLHCGSNSFQLAKVGSKWLITSIIDSRRKEVCITREEERTQIQEDINSLMDQWHLDASKGAFDSYFNFMTEDSFFLGTDESEVWTKKQFMDFSRPHFADGEAWSFTSKRRSIHISDNLRTAWFDEDLDTWMGICRGSGIIVNENGVWKLKHYVLSIAIPNDKINDYRALFEK